jgi:hypothetical protein
VFNPLAAIHRCHVAFWIGVGLITAVFAAILVLANVRKSDLATQPGASAGD